MSPRDRYTYVECTGIDTDGANLLTVHNLRPADVALLAELLRQRRTTNVLVMHEGREVTNAVLLEHLQKQIARIDQLLNELNNLRRHAHRAA